MIRGEFRKLWLGQLVSTAGSAVTAVALPLVAVLTLQATPWEMGLLTALGVAPQLILGLPAGVWIDRCSLRLVLVATDTGRALLLGGVPLLSLTGLLQIEHLYVIAVLVGVLTLFAETASHTLVPNLVPRDELVRANSAMLFNQTVASTTGPSLAGFLVQVLSAPLTILLDAVSYLISAVTALMIKEPPRESSTHLKPRLTTGLSFLFHDRVLAALTTSSTISAFAAAVHTPILFLYLARDLRWSPALVGLAITTTGAASVAGTLVVPRLAARLGVAHTYLVGISLSALPGITLVTGLTPLVFIAQACTGFALPLYGIPQRTLRQTLVPPHLLAPTTSAWRTLVMGGQAVAAVAAGLMTTTLGARTTLAVTTPLTLIALARARWSPLVRT